MSLKLYTYRDMAEIFKVGISTVRNWKYAGDFKVYGYRRLGRWAREALVKESEVKLLIKKKYEGTWKKM